MDYIKQNIIRYLESKGWVWGGTLSREVREQMNFKHKESVIERRARELARDKIIESDYEQIEGKGPQCVKYRIAEKPEPIKTELKVSQLTLTK